MCVMGKFWDIHTYMGSPFFDRLQLRRTWNFVKHTWENVECSHPKMCKALKCFSSLCEFFFLFIQKSAGVPRSILKCSACCCSEYLSQNTVSLKMPIHLWTSMRSGPCKYSFKLLQGFKQTRQQQQTRKVDFEGRKVTVVRDNKPKTK